MAYLALLSILAALTLWGCWIAVTEGCYESIKGPLEAGSYFEVLRTAFVCNPWVAWVAVNAAFHWSWVTTLAVCQSYQIAILGMTTNERMNAGRYSHFRHHGHGGHSHASPFSRGCWQNSVDFLGWTCRGFLKPNREDWFHKYDIDEDADYSADANSERSTLLGGSSNGIV